MFETVADHASSYRRRIAEILARIWGQPGPNAEGPPSWARFLVPLVFWLLVFGGLIGGTIAIVLNSKPWEPRQAIMQPRPQMPATHPWDPYLSAYLLAEGPANRGPKFEAFALWLMNQVLDGSLTLTERQARDLLGPPDRTVEGPPKDWAYCFDRFGRKDCMAVVEFEDGKVKTIGRGETPKNWPENTGPGPSEGQQNAGQGAPQPKVPAP